MMFTPDYAPLWIATGFVLLLLLSGFGVSLSRTRRQQAAAQIRIAGVTIQHGPTRTIAGPRKTAKDEWSRYIPSLLNFAGYDPGRKAQYPVAWWIVVIVAVLLARGEAGLSGVLLGQMSLIQMPVMTFIFARSYWRFYDRRRQKLLYSQLPDALGTIVRAVRVGIPVSEALRAVAREAPEPTAEEFRRLSDQVRIGAALESALIETAARSGVAEYRFFATAIALQAQTGGGLTETLETLADVIRKRIALRKRGYALAAEARTSAGLLAALPFVTGGALAVVNPSYISLLFTDPIGQKILAAAIGMLLLGVATMRFLIKKSLS